MNTTELVRRASARRAVAPEPAGSPFDRHFEAVLADREAGREANYRVRYQVYCRDMQWEDAAQFPDGMERDRYDAISRHFLVRRRRTEDWVAAMRLIVAPVEALPIWKHTSIDPERLREVLRHPVLEISRLCVVSKYRRFRRGEEARDFDDSFLNSEYRASESWLLIGFLRAARQFSEENGIRHWLFFVTDALARVVRSSGFDIEVIGPQIEHRGLRRPCLHTLATGTASMAARAPDVHAMYRLSPGYRLFSQLFQEPRDAQRSPR